MKKLFLVRHAKSDQNSNLKDIDRSLNERGYANAYKMSSEFKENCDLIISSPGIRAFSTSLIFARSLGYDYNKISLKKELYESSIKDYLSVIHTIDDHYKAVMLFAHNPTITDFAESLTKTLPMEMPTCAIVGINLDVDSWKKVKTGELFLFDYPKKNNE